MAAAGPLPIERTAPWAAAQAFSTLHKTGPQTKKLPQQLPKHYEKSMN
jgi:hypothetical protein